MKVGESFASVANEKCIRKQNEENVFNKTEWKKHLHRGIEIQTIRQTFDINKSHKNRDTFSSSSSSLLS